MGFDIMSFAQNKVNDMVRQNPNLMRNPQTRAMIEAIQQNDSQKGQEIANNLCQTFGTDKNSAMNNAMSMFFGGNNQNGRR